jgi:hypothetical protein
MRPRTIRIILILIAVIALVVAGLTSYGMIGNEAVEARDQAVTAFETSTKALTDSTLTTAAVAEVAKADKTLDDAVDKQKRNGLTGALATGAAVLAGGLAIAGAVIVDKKYANEHGGAIRQRIGVGSKGTTSYKKRKDDTDAHAQLRSVFGDS